MALNATQDREQQLQLIKNWVVNLLVIQSNLNSTTTPTIDIIKENFAKCITFHSFTNHELNKIIEVAKVEAEAEKEYREMFCGE